MEQKFKFNIGDVVDIHGYNSSVEKNCRQDFDGYYGEIIGFLPGRGTMWYRVKLKYFNKCIEKTFHESILSLKEGCTGTEERLVFVNTDSGCIIHGSLIMKSENNFFISTENGEMLLPVKNYRVFKEVKL